MTDEKTKQKAMEAAADIYGIFNKKKNCVYDINGIN